MFANWLYLCSLPLSERQALNKCVPEDALSLVISVGPDVDSTAVTRPLNRYTHLCVFPGPATFLSRSLACGLPLTPAFQSSA